MLLNQNFELCFNVFNKIDLYEYITIIHTEINQSFLAFVIAD